MHRTLTALAVLSLTAPALAREVRQLDAHEHGVSSAEITVEQQALVIEIYSPGMHDCADTSAITTVDFPFFDAFPNAVEIQARYVTVTGSGAGKVERGDASLAIE